MWNTALPYWEFIVRGVVVYVFVLILLRLGGKRQIGQMGAGEFVAILLISNAVQNSMNGGDNSLTGGLILAGVILALSVLVSHLTYKHRRWEHVIQGRPTLLIYKGKVLHEHLAKERMNFHELKTTLRRQGIHDVSDVAEAVLESDGYVSVTKKSDLHPNHLGEGSESAS